MKWFVETFDKDIARLFKEMDEIEQALTRLETSFAQRDFNADS